MDKIQQILVNNHRGMVNQAPEMFQERQPPEFARYASDVVFDLQGNVFVANGYEVVGPTTTGIGLVANVSCVYYSTTLEQIILLHGTELIQFNPNNDTAPIITSGAFAAGSKLSIAEWPILDLVFITDGIVYKSLNSVGTFVNHTASAPAGFGNMIITHKSRIWFKIGTNEICPSDTNAPTTFNTNNTIRAIEDGDSITALWSNQNLLFLGKVGTIYAIGGRDPDSFVIKNLNMTRGPVGPYAVWSFGNIDYFIAKDGLYRFNIEKIESISTLIAGLTRVKLETLGTNIGNVGSSIAASSMVIPYVPLFGPDFTRKYVLFCIRYGNAFFNDVYRYDVDSQDIVELFANSHFTFRGFAYSSNNVKTYFIEDTQTTLQSFAYVDGNFTGIYETQQIDATVRHLQKDYKRLNLFPVMPGTNVEIDFDGANIYPWNLTNLTETEFQNENLGKGYTSNIRFTNSGPVAPMIGGLCMECSVLPISRDRSFASSRRDSILNAMTLGTKPYIVGSQTMVGGETQIAVTHNLGYLPVSIIASHQGYTSDKTLTVTSVTTTGFTIMLQAAATVGHKIYWVILKRSPINLLDAGISGGRFISPSGNNLRMPHGLGDQSPAVAMFLTRISSAAGNPNGTRTFILPDPLNFQTGFAGSDPAPFEYFWLALVVQQTNPWLQAAGGMSGFGGSVGASNVFHGLGTIPSAVLLYPNVLAMPTHGITTVSATQITYTSHTFSNVAVFK